VAVMPLQPDYPDWWLKEIVKQHGEVIKQLGPSSH